MEENTEPSAQEGFFWKKRLSWLIVIGILGLGIFLIFKKSVPVAYVSRAEEKTARDIVLGIAEIKDFHTLTLKFERGGIITNDYVTVGRDITKGERLMELDTEELELEKELLTIEKKFKEEEGKLPRKDDFNLKRAKSKLKVQKRLFDKGSRPAEAVEDAARNLAILEDNNKRMLQKEQLDIDVRENDLKKVQYSIDRMSLLSPIDATVVEVLARKGDFVRQSQPVIKVIDKRRLILGIIGEEDYEKVEVGHPVELKLKAFPNTVFKGEVQQILPMSDPDTNKFNIYIKADIAEDKMIPGLTGEFVVIADTHKNAVVVPSQAVFDGYVLKVVGKKVKKQEVEVGFVSLLEIEILEGVEAGDILITESNNMIEDGTFVRTEWE